MYKALYREYRPETFQEVLGQEHIIRVLQKQIEKEETIHAYIFCGTRGTGKTTIARLLAKGVNCLSDGAKPCGECSHCISVKEGTFMDLVEIDAASNNGVDNIRELRESVNYPPTLGRKKVYIIDEVHMLSSGAFNALLKTLEEPPAHVMFILATTEPEKLPATILSRCMRMDFRRVSEKVMMEKMESICVERDIKIEQEALGLIAGNADGSVRDGLTILDQCISGKSGTISREEVLDSLGGVGVETFLGLTRAVMDHDPEKGLTLINKTMEEGKDPRQILQGWMSHYRDLLITKYIKKPENVINASTENVKRLRAQSEEASLEAINYGILELSKTINLLRTSSLPRVLLEMTFVKLATESFDGVAVMKTTRVSEKKPEVKKVVTETKEVPKKKKETIAKVEKKDPEAPALDMDKDQVWQAFLTDGEKQLGGMFAMVANGASLARITDYEVAFYATGMSQLFMEKNRETLEEILEPHVGGKKRVVIIDETQSSEEKAVTEVAKAAENVLGIEIEVK